ncbi:hypothetical protein [Bradyrhizobium sp. 199]|uniref:hypothetical protein n=1 Tax=Bradyrhizobium sp. 199 TaxID=2782664 RepID=UPI001FF82410|nr:hypothetical protein [Bradyrhizobium sp. 199]MCK1360597.1 hypothetical protein [Bradyrhizobium sp. 199]
MATSVDGHLTVQASVAQFTIIEEYIAVAKTALVFLCAFLSYFLMTWFFFGYWGQALATGVFATLIFCPTLFIAWFAARGRRWRAFWLANTVLVLLFGGLELWSLLSIERNHATRFGGALLSEGGHITLAGYASLIFDLAVGTASNFLGFWLSQVLIKRFDIN